jgi:hypothetical protein
MTDIIEMDEPQKYTGLKAYIDNHFVLCVAGLCVVVAALTIAANLWMDSVEVGKLTGERIGMVLAMCIGYKMFTG